MKLQYLLIALCFSTLAAGSTIPLKQRGLDDVFGGLDGPLPLEGHPEEHNSAHEQPSHATNHPLATIPLLPTPTNSGSNTKSKDSTTQSHSQSASGVSPTYSVIGSVPPLPSGSLRSTDSVSSGTSPTSAVSTPTYTEPVTAQQAESKGAQEWKIVGVAVIAFTTVAAILLLSVFFDQWWGFMRDLLWKKKREDDFEELVPDWQRASWAFHLEGDRHRYPTIPPAASTKQEVNRAGKQALYSPNNIAGVGAGMKEEMISEPTPRQDYQSNSPWARGLGLSPLPPAAQLQRSPSRTQRDRLYRHDSNPFEPKTHAPPSPALTDPYGGIAE
ncbi:hypothetical protein BDW22DRAFT_1480088 [Trametopsis cervina]|nr:hypothetical protein BDW22DRAFT_1480088 [Trametopsis cervina]